MRRRSLKRLTNLSAAALLTELVVLSTLPAHAINIQGLAAYPTGKAAADKPYFIAEIQPGETYDDQLTIINTSTQPQTVDIYPVDAIPTSGGGFGMFDDASPRDDLASWVSLSANALRVSAGENQTVKVRFVVPAKATIGAHYGGIIVKPRQTTTTTAGDQTSVNVVSRLGVRVYLTVSGQARPMLRVSAPALSYGSGSVHTSVRLFNSGNTLLAPLGSVIIKTLSASWLVASNSKSAKPSNRDNKLT